MVSSQKAEQVSNDHYRKHLFDGPKKIPKPLASSGALPSPSSSCSGLDNSDVLGVPFVMRFPLRQENHFRGQHPDLEAFLMVLPFPQCMRRKIHTVFIKEGWTAARHLDLFAKDYSETHDFALRIKHG